MDILEDYDFVLLEDGCLYCELMLYETEEIIKSPVKTMLFSEYKKYEYGTEVELL